MVINALKQPNKTCNLKYVNWIFLLFVVLQNPLPALGSYPEEQPGSRSASLGYAVTGIADSWGLFYNQAALGYAENAWVGLHHENRFLSPDLSFSALGGIIPVKPGALGVSIKRLGFSQYNQTQAGIAYGMKLANSFSAGIQINAHHVYIAGEYGSTTAFSAEMGILYSPNQNLSIGLHVFNPTRSKIYAEERMPTVINLGVSYRLSDMVIVVAGVENNVDNKSTFKGGIEFVPIKNLYFRTGMASQPSLLSFGLGYSFSSFTVDLAFTRHEYLGYTPHLSLSYTFGHRKATGNAESEKP